MMPRKLIRSFGVSSSSSSHTTTSTTSTPEPGDTPTPSATAPAKHHHHLLHPTLASLVPPSLLATDLLLPRLVVFDLDYTLWPFWADTHPTAPVKPMAGSTTTLHTTTTATSVTLVDKHGETYSFYDDVPSILWILPRLGIKVGVASRTHAPDLAREMLKQMVVTPPMTTTTTTTTTAAATTAATDEASFAAQSKKDLKPRRALDLLDGGVEIYPGSKMAHMQALARKSGVAFDDMLFFDDEARNREVERLGVTMQLVPSGVSWREVERGVEEWRRRRDM